MQLDIKWDDGSYSVQTDETESGVMFEIGKSLLKIKDFPNTISAASPLGTIRLDIIARGEYIDEYGHSRPSPHCTNISYCMALQKSTYKKAILTCVNAREDVDTGNRANNYKRYDLVPIGNPTMYVDAYYGRLNSFFDGSNERFSKRKVKVPYEPVMYWPIYFEKIAKGYVDNTEQYEGEIVKKKKIQKTPETPSELLYSRLASLSHNTVKSALVNQNITKTQLSSAKKYLNAMRKRKTVEGFNRQLEQLVMVSPRHVQYTAQLFAKDAADFPQIVAREEALINAMDTVGGSISSFSKNIEVYKATDAQYKHVIERLSPELKSKVKNVYRIINRKSKKHFDDYIEANNIKNIKELWHGSRNENWISITEKGLKITPDAITTGKMLGYGIYFAPSSMKSWGYTSSYGSRWAGGNSNTAFMGLYATAYGKPYMADTYQKKKMYTVRELADLGCDCVHATKDCGLLNDEICFYKEEALLLNYIVEFGT